MIVRGLSDYPEWLSSKLFTGNFGAVSLAYRLPAAIYYKDKVYLVKERAQLVRVLATFQAILSHYRLSGVTTKVVNAPDWTSKRFEVLVEQTFKFELGETEQKSRMRFFVERRGLRPGINMVQVERVPFGKQVTKQRALRSLEVEAPAKYQQAAFVPDARAF